MPPRRTGAHPGRSSSTTRSCSAAASPCCSASRTTSRWWVRPSRRRRGDRAGRGRGPDVVLMDVRMPKRSGIEACVAIKEVAPSARIIMLTVSDEEADLYDAIKNGASGYLLKDASIDEVAQAVRVVADGQSLISPSMAVKLLDEFKQMSRADRQQVPRPGSPTVSSRCSSWSPRGLNNREIAKRAVHQREHRQEPRAQHLGEAAAALPDGGRDVRRAREAARHPVTAHSRRSRVSRSSAWLAGTPHRAGCAGFLDPRHTTPDHAHLPHPRAHRRAADRLGQRAAARALHAAVLPDGPLRRRAAAPGLRQRAAADGGVLGARGGLHAGRAVAATCSTGWRALPTQARPRVDRACAQARARRPRCSPRSASAGRSPRATSTTACPAPRTTGAGTGRRPRRRWSTCSSPASSRSPAATRSSSGSTTCPSG